MPKFLYFDLGNVLVHFDNEIALANLARESVTTRDNVFHAIFTTGLGSQYERGIVSSGEFCATLRSELNTTIADEAICLAISDMFSLNESIIPLISSLRSRQITLGILSNTCEAHWNFVNDRFSFANLFGVHALSFELKTAKPDPEIYQQAAKMAGVSPKDIFFTDDLQPNVDAARAAGFDATLFTTVEKLASELTERGMPTH